MNLKTIILAVCSLLFLMIGLDKFISFLDPPCSLEGQINPIIWKIIGVLQLTTAVLVWTKYQKYVVGFFAVFMLVFTVIHLTQNTSDVGGAAFMAVLLGILIWNPPLIQKNFKHIFSSR